MRLIRDEQWKYVYRNGTGPSELYHLAVDPGEQENLAGNPEHAQMEDELRSRLLEWFARYVDPKVDGANEVVTGSGQFGRCGDYADGQEAFSKSRVSHLGVK